MQILRPRFQSQTHEKWAGTQDSQLTPDPQVILLTWNIWEKAGLAAWAGSGVRQVRVIFTATPPGHSESGSLSEPQSPPLLTGDDLISLTG